MDDDDVLRTPSSGTGAWVSPRRELLDRADCLDLLRRTATGQLVVSERDDPVVLPVAFRCVEGAVLVPTRGRSRLAALAHGTTVALVVDDGGCDEDSGWTVSVLGRAAVEPAFGIDDARGPCLALAADRPDDGAAAAAAAPAGSQGADAVLRVPLTLVIGHRTAALPEPRVPSPRAPGHQR